MDGNNERSEAAKRFRTRKQTLWKSQAGQTVLGQLSAYFRHCTHGFDDFYPEQLAALSAIVERRVTLVKLPTGRGKTVICFAALKLLGGICVLVCPTNVIVSNHAQKCPPGITVVSLPDLNSFDRAPLLDSIAGATAGAPPMLIIGHPQHFLCQDMLAAFTESASSLAVSLVCVDEGGLVPDWGHDFRTEFQQLRKLRAAIADGVLLPPSLVVLEAACSDEAMEGILLGLGVSEAEQREMEVVSAPSDRQELRPVFFSQYSSTCMFVSVCVCVLFLCLSCVLKHG